jgi:peptidoglycan hydrolase CwlO-like protein
MNETMLKYAKLMLENGEEHLRRMEDWITTTEKQLEDAREKRDEVTEDMKELKAQFPEEEELDEDESDEE